jgi:hypothetical protein
MRAVAVNGAVMVSALAVWLQAAPAGDSVAKMLADARQALGGEQRLTAVRSFTAKGVVKRGEGPGNRGSFDLACELPDKFVRTEDSPVRGQLDHEITVLGFNDGKLIYQPNLPDVNRPRAQQTEAQLQARLLTAKQDFAQVTLGLFATSFSGAPLTFVEAEGTKAGTAVEVMVSDISLAAGAPITGWSWLAAGGGVAEIVPSITLTFDPHTHLPAGLGHFVYSDYRDVDGLQVPFRFAWIVPIGSHGVAPGTIAEEWDIKEFHFNVAIDPKVFRPSAGLGSR